MIGFKRPSVVCKIDPDGDHDWQETMVTYGGGRYYTFAALSYKCSRCGIETGGGGTEGPAVDRQPEDTE